MPGKKTLQLVATSTPVSCSSLNHVILQGSGNWRRAADKVPAAMQPGVAAAVMGEVAVAAAGKRVRVGASLGHRPAPDQQQLPTVVMQERVGRGG